MTCLMFKTMKMYSSQKVFRNWLYRQVFFLFAIHLDAGLDHKTQKKRALLNKHLLSVIHIDYTLSTQYNKICALNPFKELLGFTLIALLVIVRHWHGPTLKA